LIALSLFTKKGCAYSTATQLLFAENVVCWQLIGYFVVLWGFDKIPIVHNAQKNRHF
jgi:hypothetical protein